MKLLRLIPLLFIFFSCKKNTPGDAVVLPEVNLAQVKKDSFLFGADLSHVNNILDHNGIYKTQQGQIQDPTKIFKDNGGQLARFRLWHNPTWTKTAYGASGTQLYNDLFDVEKAMTKARQNGMQLLLDFHYSDSWADPGKQEIPAAWRTITNINVLRDSVNNYTFKTLQYLNSKGLMPEYVQLGNEINCGLLYTNAPAGFPALNVCNGNWQNLATVLNGGISAVRTASTSSVIKSKIILHVADPNNVEWWFSGIAGGGITDYDVVGFSYYPTWHIAIKPNRIADYVKLFRTTFSKKVMVVETAYPWTTATNDSYNNLMGTEPIVNGYPYTQAGQLSLLEYLTQQLINGGASGIIYWEPAWITSSMKDGYGTGSAWENVSFFDYTGNAHQGMNYMTHTYQWKP
jgi:arabinogalactan endo-1,4-beta-galactosidase